MVYTNLAIAQYYSVQLPGNKNNFLKEKLFSLLHWNLINFSFSWLFYHTKKDVNP